MKTASLLVALTTGLLLCQPGAARADRLLSDFNGTGFDTASPSETTGPTFDTLSTPNDVSPDFIVGEFDYPAGIDLSGLTAARLTFDLTLTPTASAFIGFRLGDTSGNTATQPFVLFSASTGGFVTQDFALSATDTFGGADVDLTAISSFRISVVENIFGGEPDPDPVTLAVDNLLVLGAAPAPEPSTWACVLGGAAAMLGARRWRRRS